MATVIKIKNIEEGSKVLSLMVSTPLLVTNLSQTKEQI